MNLNPESRVLSPVVQVMESEFSVLGQDPCQSCHIVSHNLEVIFTKLMHAHPVPAELHVPRFRITRFPSGVSPSQEVVFLNGPDVLL